MRRYVYQHGYNLSMPELVDKIASPTVKASMTEWTYKKLDSFPTPLDYTDALASGDQPILLCQHSPDFCLLCSVLLLHMPPWLDSQKALKVCTAWHAAGLPQLKALWERYHDAFGLDALLVPATIATARPISDVKPYMSVNGKKVRRHRPHSILNATNANA